MGKTRNNGDEVHRWQCGSANDNQRWAVHCGSFKAEDTLGRRSSTPRVPWRRRWSGAVRRGDASPRRTGLRRRSGWPPGPTPRTGRPPPAGPVGKTAALPFPTVPTGSPDASSDVYSSALNLPDEVWAEKVRNDPSSGTCPPSSGVARFRLSPTWFGWLHSVRSDTARLPLVSGCAARAGVDHQRGAVRPRTQAPRQWTRGLRGRCPGRPSARDVCGVLLGRHPVCAGQLEAFLVRHVRVRRPEPCQFLLHVLVEGGELLPRATCRPPAGRCGCGPGRPRRLCHVCLRCLPRSDGRSVVVALYSDRSTRRARAQAATASAVASTVFLRSSFQ